MSSRRRPAGIPSGGQFSEQPHDEADITLEPASPVVTGPTDGFRCEDCDELSTNLGGPVYECSRCGTNQIDERRCAQCNIFMAKISDESCEGCGEATECAPAQIWMVGSQEFGSPEEAEQWITDAPEREAATLRSREWLDAHMARRDAVNQERMEAVRPRLAAALELMNESDAPTMYPTMRHVMDHFEDGRAEFYQVSIDMGDVIRTRFPELSDTYQIACDYEVDWEERRAADDRIRTSVLGWIDLEPDLVSRLDDWSSGSRPVVDIEQALDMMLTPRH